jgi:hypothetical protein
MFSKNACRRLERSYSSMLPISNQTKKKKKKKAHSVPERFRSRTKQPGDSQEAEVRKDLG